MKKWLHIAGIAGKMTSNMALLYKQQGYFVTGSDMNCSPPATDLLDEHQIPYVQDHHYTHLTKVFWEERLKTTLDIPEIPDKAIFVSTLSKKNKEYLFAQSKGIEIMTIAQAVGKDIAKRESIVSVGTAGKTTTTALLVHILDGLGFDPSYMIGAELADGRQAMHMGNTEWSVLEGDEFYGTKIEEHSKFFEYKPKYLLLNKIEWDHADVFPTEEEYINNFRNLLRSLPGNGLLLANAGDPNVRMIAASSKARVKWFNAFDEVNELINTDGDKLYWHLETVDISKGKFIAKSAEKAEDFSLEFTTQLIGKYNHQNVLAVIAMLYELFANNIDWDEVSELIASFKGIQKRLQVVFENDKYVVVDDLGGPPLKVRSGIEALQSKYAGYKTIVLYEPNSGNRVKDNLEVYRNISESKIDVLIIPTLSTYDDGLLSSEDIVNLLNSQGFDNAYSVATEEVEKFVKQHMDKDKPNLIVFFNSYRFTEVARGFSKMLTS